MSYASLVLLIVIHVIFDFVLQSRETATNKSSNLKYLMPHLFMIFIGMTIFASLSGRYETQNQAGIFIFGNVILHGLIDWNIWKLYKVFTYIQIKRGKRENLFTITEDQVGDYKYWEDATFYNFIAIDQALHGLCYIGLDCLARSL